MTPTVLLVDDDEHVLAALRRAFRHEPYVVRVADGPAAALRILATESVDVIVTDEAMPGMRGTEFLAQVHAQYPDTIGIVVTGHASLEVAMRAINRGSVYRFFTKPCDTDEVALAIRQGLMQRALLVQSRRLLRTMRHQYAEIEKLEGEVRGITWVERDESGAVLLDSSPVDLESLLAEMEKELDTAEERLAARRAAEPRSPIAKA
jgi:two-component system, probable response regulator PhcQ